MLEEDDEQVKPMTKESSEIEKINESEKENEKLCATDDKAALLPDAVVKPLEMKISKKKKIVFV